MLPSLFSFSYAKLLLLFSTLAKVTGLVSKGLFISIFIWHNKTTLTVLNSAQFCNSCSEFNYQNIEK